jgi:ORF6N domain
MNCPLDAGMPNGLRQRIFRLRAQAVMLDADLAALYGVKTKALLQAVRRNPARFPEDFAFQINVLEWQALRSQFVTSNGRGGRRSLPYAFSEHGALQLASVLKSDRAVAVSLLVVRVFVRMRQLAQSSGALLARLDELERRIDQHDESLQELLAAIRRLISQPEPVSRPIGFTADLDSD